MVPDQAAIQRAVADATAAARALGGDVTLNTVDGNVGDGRNATHGAAWTLRQRLGEARRNASVMRLLRGAKRDVILVHDVDHALSCDRCLGSWLLSDVMARPGTLLLLLHASLMAVPPRWRDAIALQPWNQAEVGAEEQEMRDLTRRSRGETTAVFRRALRDAAALGGDPQPFADALAKGLLDVHTLSLFMAQNPPTRGRDGTPTPDLYAATLRVCTDVATWGHRLDPGDLRAYVCAHIGYLLRTAGPPPSASSIRFPAYINHTSKQAAATKAALAGLNPDTSRLTS